MFLPITKHVLHNFPCNNARVFFFERGNLCLQVDVEQPEPKHLFVFAQLVTCLIQLCNQLEEVVQQVPIRRNEVLLVLGASRTQRRGNRRVVYRCSANQEPREFGHLGRLIEHLNVPAHFLDLNDDISPLVD